ncbi:hypothetical protein GOBAR_DD19740 [Gossypium barbadense]|nr:hypothetical protein GOBAR_DD19740 [Gossypium barbadense]
MEFERPTTEIDKGKAKELQIEFSQYEHPVVLTVEAQDKKHRYYVVSALADTKSELPLVGNPAPDFEAEAVFDQEFIKVKLSEYIGKKYVILFFYPLDFTFVCPTAENQLTSVFERKTHCTDRANQTTAAVSLAL